MNSWLCGAQFCYFLTDVLCTGVWEALGDYQQPELQTLAASLQATVLSAGHLRPQVNISMPLHGGGARPGPMPRLLYFSKGS